MKRQQDKLLIIIAMSGEMPTYLGQYVTGSISYTAALITRLKKERYISLRCKDGYRGYVLLEKGRNYLLSEYEKELSFFISGSGQTGHVKSEPEKRMRLYRIEIVKAQFAKLTKDHVEFVLQSMDDTSTKARNIRAVLLTALYNSVNTINSYYGNRYHFHLAEETRREMEETD